MVRKRSRAWWLAIITGVPTIALAQGYPAHSGNEVRLRIEASVRSHRRQAPAVVWLDPIAATAIPPFVPHGRYALVQKNRTFIPHLQVIPVNSVVQFPNEDPFFHNVFSLFDGKRFDLGLYEAGSSKFVTFSRIGVSYIFCNIHPEMSAVIISLATPYYGIADDAGNTLLRSVLPGDYTLHIWIEGVPRSQLEHLSRTVHIPSHAVNLGIIETPPGSTDTKHNNMYGDTYPREPQSPPY